MKDNRVRTDAELEALYAERYSIARVRPYLQDPALHFFDHRRAEAGGEVTEPGVIAEARDETVEQYRQWQVADDVGCWIDAYLAWRDRLARQAWLDAEWLREDRDAYWRTRSMWDRFESDYGDYLARCSAWGEGVTTGDVRQYIGETIDMFSARGDWDWDRDRVRQAFSRGIEAWRGPGFFHGNLTFREAAVPNLAALMRLLGGFSRMDVGEAQFVSIDERFATLCPHDKLTISRGLHIALKWSSRDEPDLEDGEYEPPPAWEVDVRLVGDVQDAGRGFLFRVPKRAWKKGNWIVRGMTSPSAARVMAADGQDEADRVAREAAEFDRTNAVVSASLEALG